MGVSREKGNAQNGAEGHERVIQTRSSPGDDAMNYVN